MLPQQHGVKALYGVQQMHVEYLQQQRRQQHHAWICGTPVAKRPKPNRAITIFFIFMGMTVLGRFRANGLIHRPDGWRTPMVQVKSTIRS
jgi:hypothetical protein